MGGVTAYDWFVWKDGRSVGPLSSTELALLSFQKHIDGRDLVWCQGMAGWLPLGSALGANDGPTRLEVVETADPDGVPARAAAMKIASLSELYLQNLSKRNIPHPAPLQAAREPRLPAAHDAVGSTRAGRGGRSVAAATSTAGQPGDWLAASPTLAYAAENVAANRRTTETAAAVPGSTDLAAVAPPPAHLLSTIELRPPLRARGFEGLARKSGEHDNSATGGVPSQPRSRTERQGLPDGIFWQKLDGPEYASPFLNTVASNARQVAARILITILDRHGIKTVNDLASDERIAAIASAVYDYIPLSGRAVIASTIGRDACEGQLRELLNTVRANVDPQWRNADARELVLHICSGWLEKQIASGVSSAAATLTSYTSEVGGWLDGVASSLRDAAPVRTVTGFLAGPPELQPR